MKNAWFFGDSFTFGEGCREGFEYYDKIEWNDKRIWTTILSDELKLKENNHGMRGGSSPHILSKLLEYSPEFKKGDYVIFSDSLPNRIVSANQKRNKIETVIADSFTDFYGLDNFFENQESKNAMLNHLYYNVIPFDSAYTHFYDRQFEQLQKLLFKNGINSFYWSHSMWARDKRKYERISNHTNGVIKDGHFSWNGHKQFYEMILNSIKTNKHIIHRNFI